MIFAGIQKNTLIDFPGKIACVFFVSGCNFECPYCHNPQLARGIVNNAEVFDEDEAIEFLSARRDFLDGVVISGGEPTLQEDLPQVCDHFKQMGFPVKIDTNGSRPEVLKQLIDEKRVDYIAMDIKTDPVKYSPVIAKNFQPKHIFESIHTILEAQIAHEFKTTCIKPIVNATVIKTISRLIQGADRYALQYFQDTAVLQPRFFEAYPDQYKKDDLRRFKAIAAPWVQECLIR